MCSKHVFRYIIFSGQTDITIRPGLWPMDTNEH